MTRRIALPWWPFLVFASPVLLPVLIAKNRRYKKNLDRVQKNNSERMKKAKPLELPELESLELTVLVEWAFEEGFMNDPGVSYLFKSDKGSLLYDVGFGPATKTLSHNAGKLGITFDEIDALAISHLHPDHMGGIKATRSKMVLVPDELGNPSGKRCFLPDEAKALDFSAEMITGPRLLAGGIVSTGPLARSLFFLGYTEEQALIIRIKGKGIVIFTGCGHPKIEVILKMVRRLTNEPIYAIGGGLHFPITSGRGNYAGIQMQMLIGTGLPLWRRITDDELGQTINAINDAGPKKVFLSAHDTCDHSLRRFENELKAETLVLSAGASYQL